MILLNTNLRIFVCLYVHTPCYCNNVPWLWLELRRFLKVSIQATYFEQFIRQQNSWSDHRWEEKEKAWTGRLPKLIPRTDQLRAKPCLQSNHNIINVIKYFQCKLMKSPEVQEQLTIPRWQSSSCEENCFPGIFLFRKLAHFSFLVSTFSVHGKVLSGCSVAYLERQQGLSHSRYSWFQPVPMDPPQDMAEPISCVWCHCRNVLKKGQKHQT